ncbi:hypothetical protein PFLmoz3_04949 [Pseudomonas fluorescens]|uniref:Ribbon-helix-helix domain-containing protein n=1 Tax=Pseudomonas fluorescens TaxID=294 RepID=A0A109LDF3_PSEFL|nr:hypothetical protein PFLmoz3_04949 [Pseudomonas fluorescens]
MSRGVGKGMMEACGFHKIKVDPFTKGFDMGLAKPLSRSVRLNGFSTCLRLEQIYWNILTEIPGSIPVRSVRCCPMSIGKCICVTEA